MTSALAADLPPGSPEYRAPAQVVADRFTWTGIYVGANAGYGTGMWTDTTGTGDDRVSGALAGGQIGANLQTGSFVFGVEGDFQASWQKKTVNSVVGGVAVSASEELPWFGTARARAGFAFDRALLYVTGGGAWVDLKLSGTALGVTVSSEQSKMAWTAGAGLEWMIADHWSAKIEYLYIDTGNTSVTLLGLALNGRLQDQIGRFGVNYHF
jgi:outer membrane immunogenic protein